MTNETKSSTKVCLDRSRDYGSVVNDPEGRAYEQDGRFFCIDGSLWVDPTAKKESVAERGAREAAEKAEAQRLAAEEKAAAAAGKANPVDDQLAKQA